VTIMPRPKEGYFNAAGQPVPAVGEAADRYMDRSRLLYWAFNRGKSGASKLYDNSALDIGTVVHKMAECDLRGDEDADIGYYLNNTLPDPEGRAKAVTSFTAYRQWRAKLHVRPVAQEVSLVSEKHQYGGTLDVVGIVGNELSLLDFKTSSEA